MTQSEELNTNQQDQVAETETFPAQVHVDMPENKSENRLTQALNDIEIVLEQYLKQPVHQDVTENMDEIVANIDVLIAQVTDVLEQVKEHHSNHIDISQEAEHN